MNKHKIIEKWYRKLSFPQQYDDAFFDLLYRHEIVDNADINSYQFGSSSADGGLNLLMCLYFCEALELEYQKKGIPDAVLYDTLSDIVLWTMIHHDLYGSVGVSETDWLKLHLSFQLFRLGRLQFGIGECHKDIKEINGKKGDKLLQIHIPRGGALLEDACLDSIRNAKLFFAKYFPEIQYKAITCYSWLLDDTLLKFMKEDANTIKFQRLFQIFDKKEAYDVLRFTVRWNITKETMHLFQPTNSFTKRVMEYIEQGGRFYVGYGYLK